MKVLSATVLHKLNNEEDVFCFGTTLYLVEPWGGSPHISLHLAPIFGQVKREGQKLMFFKEKANGNGFVSKGRLFNGLTCFDDEMEAVNYFNSEIRNFVDRKNYEIRAAEALLVQSLNG